MKKLKKTVKSMVAEAKTKISEINAKEAINLFKNDDVINSVESIHMSGPEKGQMTHYSLSWNGRCQRLEN